MKISELIAELEKIKEENGDLEINIGGGEKFHEIELQVDEINIYTFKDDWHDEKILRLMF